MVIADISGSVAFARFTLHLVYALNNQFSKVRSFVFIDGLDEVTDFFENVDDITEAIHRVNTEADVIWVDGHSDYGHAFEIFEEKFAKDIGPKTTVIILGDARNNYHASQSWVIKNIEDKARKVFWLNPEPRSYWDTGDSIVGEYSNFCNGTFEVRNLKQLEVLLRILSNWSAALQLHETQAQGFAMRSVSGRTLFHNAELDHHPRGFRRLQHTQ